MKTLRRFDIRDRYYFITCVTHDRNKILLDNIDLFWSSWHDTPLEAWAIMLDHFHAIIKIDKIAISDIMHKFKITYSRRYRNKYKAPGKVWQNRFWDHIIRDQEDMNRHLDYIHYNAVHHGFAQSPFDWRHSSLCRWTDEGFYQSDWGVGKRLKLEGDFGE